MNIVDYLKGNGYKVEQLECGKWTCKYTLYLSGVGITSVENFVQNGDLYLSDNPITEIPKDFVQNGDLHLCNTLIDELPENFKIPLGRRLDLTNAYFHLQYNGSLSIENSNRPLTEWYEVFTSKEPYSNELTILEYQCIKKWFKSLFKTHDNSARHLLEEMLAELRGREVLRSEVFKTNVDAKIEHTAMMVWVQAKLIKELTK